MNKDDTDLIAEIVEMNKNAPFTERLAELCDSIVVDSSGTLLTTSHYFA